jgi:autotransporter-associated beta strand protein
VTDNALLIVTSTGNTVPTVNVADGTLRLGANSALPTGTNVLLGQAVLNGDFGTLDLAGFSQQVGSLTVRTGANPTHQTVGNSSATADSTLTVTGTSTFDGIIQDTLGGGTRKTAVTVTGGTVALGGANTYTGATTVTGGTLQVSGSIASTSISVTSPGAFNAVVVSAADSGAGTLRQAVAETNHVSGVGPTITFGSLFNTAQTITLTSGELDLTDSVTTTITGPGAALLSVSGNNASRVLDISAGASAALSGLTITGGNVSGPGGGLLDLGTATLTNCTVTGNTAK